MLVTLICSQLTPCVRCLMGRVVSLRSRGFNLREQKQARWDFRFTRLRIFRDFPLKNLVEFDQFPRHNTAQHSRRQSSSEASHSGAASAVQQVRPLARSVFSLAALLMLQRPTDPRYSLLFVEPVGLSPSEAPILRELKNPVVFVSYLTKTQFNIVLSAYRSSVLYIAFAISSMIFCAFLISTLRAACSAHLILVDLSLVLS